MSRAEGAFIWQRFYYHSIDLLENFVQRIATLYACISRLYSKIAHVF